jgi:hypothetical protein
LIGWLTAALRPTGPHPILVITGEQGSAKSTLARICRLLVDPHSAPLRAEPKDNRDLMVAALHGWVQAYDNLSCMPDWLSNGLCRLVTGGGISTRGLFTNHEEVVWSAHRPIWTGYCCAKTPGWPKTPNVAAVELRRIAPQLSMFGVSVTFERSSSAGRLVTFTPADSIGPSRDRVG